MKPYYYGRRLQFSNQHRVFDNWIIGDDAAWYGKSDLEIGVVVNPTIAKLGLAAYKQGHPTKTKAGH